MTEVYKPRVAEAAGVGPPNMGSAAGGMIALEKGGGIRERNHSLRGYGSYLVGAETLEGTEDIC